MCKDSQAKRSISITNNLSKVLVVTRFAPDTESLFCIDKLIDGWDKVLPGVLHIVYTLRTLPSGVGPPLALPSVGSQLDPPGIATVGNSQ